MKKKVSIIIVNWNGKEHLKRCLESLFEINYKNYEVIISDNSSEDGSIAYIKMLQKQRKNIFLVQNTENLGYAEGNNVGYKVAKGEYLLLLNNDAVVDKNFLQTLVEILKENKTVAAVQPKILQYPRTNYIDSVGSYLINSGFLYHYGHNKKDEKKYNIPAEIFSMKGACMLLRKSVIDKIGLFDKDYFAYFEETDMCQRICLAGYKILYIPTSKIYHIGGQTSKHLNSAFVQYNSYKNRIYTYCKNFEIYTLMKVLPLHLFLCEVVTFMYLITGKFSLALTIQKAIWWNVINIKKIIKEREKVNKLRVIHDISYLKKVSKPVRLSYYYHLFATSLAGYKD